MIHVFLQVDALYSQIYLYRGPCITHVTIAHNTNANSGLVGNGNSCGVRNQQQSFLVKIVLIWT